MRKYCLLLLLALNFSIVGALAEDSIAVVDLQRIVSNSSQVKSMKQEHSRKIA